MLLINSMVFSEEEACVSTKILQKVICFRIRPSIPLLPPNPQQTYQERSV